MVEESTGDEVGRDSRDVGRIRVSSIEISIEEERGLVG